MINYEGRVQASLLAVLIGDGLGQPVETMTPAEILAATKGRGVTGFMDTIQKRIQSQSHLKAGETTDDWQQTRSLTESLIACGGFNLEDVGYRLALAYNESTVGWGGTSREATKQLVDYYASSGARGRSPLTPVGSLGLGTGAGNGVGMKIPPLVHFCFLASNGEEGGLGSKIQSLATLTHSDPRAFYTTYALALTMFFSLRRPVMTYADAQGLLAWVNERVKAAPYWSGLPLDGETLPKLELLRGLVENPVGIAKEIKCGCLCTESVIYAIGIYLSFRTEFKTALLTAVNAGGDTDTTASMVGALIGANCGLEAIPLEWREFHPWYKDALEIGSRLYLTAKAKSRH